jgi:hypothetical protein
MIMLLFAGCKKEENITLDPTRPTDQMYLTATPAGPITLDQEQPDAEAVKFTWAQATNRGTGTSITYRFQLSVQGKSAVWEPSDNNAVQQRDVSFTHAELSKLLTGTPFNTTAGEPAIIEAKVVAEVTASIQMQPEISTVSVTVTPYGEPKNINGERLTLVGDNEDLYSVDMDLTQNQTLTVGGMDISDWWIDPDFFEKISASTLKFLPIAGKYRILADFERKYFKVQVMRGSTLASLQEDGSGAIWAIGGVGDPTITDLVDWRPIEAVCLAPMGNGRYKLSGVGGQRFRINELGIKFLPEHNSWRAIRRPDIEESDLNAADPRYAPFNNDFIWVDGGDNAHLNNEWRLVSGNTYTFIIDVSDGWQNIKISIEENGTSPTVPPENFPVTINGTPMTKVGLSGNYKAELEIQQNHPVVIGGIELEELADWWIDPDYIVFNENIPTFLPVSGKYRVTANIHMKYFKVEAMIGNDLATLQLDGSGAIWVIGEGLGKPSIVKNPVGWVPENALCMASPGYGLYRITLKTGETLNADEIDFKFFYQPRLECGFKDVPDQDCLNYGISTTSTLVQIAQDGYVRLIEGQRFEANATYTFTIDLTPILEMRPVTLTVDKIN